MHIVVSEPPAAAVAIAAAINTALAQGSVLLLVSGGSNIELAVDVRRLLQTHNRLTVGLIDERYGPEGHPDSNWAQLLAAGFDTQAVALMPVLHNETLEQTAQNYKTLLLNAVGNHDRVIGIFGIGTDGHTSGILPGSPAVNAAEPVISYIGTDFQRITTTPVFFNHIDEAFLVAYGTSKKDQLQRLQSEQPIQVQPSQALKVIPALTLITDQEIVNE